ncbi:restriction endonuclease [Saccharothrix longispora]|uniref:Restriction endonuclease n=1 Tax=Saccharothrix longispora TaxID=33920 RepID=A0ABU1Q2E3_9PSEU|nr:restriction endonuclease [Saccharothrix longispora]MDR6597061.1 hypothetical protein [Saccharothrix longispora]
MERIAVEDYTVLVLAHGSTTSEVSNAKGHLFEEFIAQLLHAFGYNKPHRDRLNPTADGIELDVTATSDFNRSMAIVECKAYTAQVKAQVCTSFLGKLQLARYDHDEDVHGYLCVLPRLVAQGEEVARKALAKDNKFHYLNAHSIVELLIDRGLVRRSVTEVESALSSDHAVLITKYGLYSCAKMLDPATHRTDHIVVWGPKAGAPVPPDVVDLLASDTYASGLSVKAVGSTPDRTLIRHQDESPPPVIVSVRGSSSDFEYQFPASPKFFVGRRALLQEVEAVIRGKRGCFVLNAQSGWGKSSLALQAKQLAEQKGGYAVVIDSRTAVTSNFVVEALREAGVGAESTHLIDLPSNASWASLQSAISTFERSAWKRDASLLIFFDQFENVFQDEATTREFRNLVLLLNDATCPLVVGFAWKTDLVTWTESHPYQLRDEIRSSSVRISLGPMGSREIETLLRRLEKSLDQKLSLDLRQRLREYSQGLPWLFKKLGNHVILEIKQNGKSQETLVSEALNVQSLFDSDLAGLSPVENEAVRHVARFAPIAATEVTEKYDGNIVQSLLDSRLVVAVGDKLDTYWDIFRDFLNTGRIPIEDSYTVRQNPSSVARLLIPVMDAGGNMSVQDLCSTLGASPQLVYNLWRELRLFGLTIYEPHRVKLLEEIIAAADPEEEIRARVYRALRRHRAYSLFIALAERLGDRVLLGSFARELPSIFPAVDAQEKTWLMYARAFAYWFDYCGLAHVQGSYLVVPPEGFHGNGRLLASDRASRSRSGYSVHYAAGPCLRLLKELSIRPRSIPELSRDERKFIAALASLNLVSWSDADGYRSLPGVVVGGSIVQERLLEALRALPGGAQALAELDADPKVENPKLGSIIKSAVGAAWKPVTVSDVGGAFRSWAKAAGVSVLTARRQIRRSDGESVAQFHDDSLAERLF